MNRAEARAALRKQISGRDIAEIEIEAQRDADLNGYDAKQNPYPSGTYAALVYTLACQQWWVNQHARNQ